MTFVILVEKLTVRISDKTILHKVDLRLKDKSLTILMGPMGGGKSTLLRVLSTKFEAADLDIQFNKALYKGSEISAACRPEMIAQKVREPGGDQKKLAHRMSEIQSIISRSPDALFLDEPTSGLSASSRGTLMECLKTIAKDRAVVVISHNADDARTYSDHVVLIASGQVVASRPTDEFFDGQSDALATHFLKTGGLDLPPESTPIQILAPEHRLMPSGYDLGFANPAMGKENWLIKSRFSLVALPVDAHGRIDRAYLKTLSPSRIVFHFNLDSLLIFTPDGEVEAKYHWKQAVDPPYRNLGLAAEICHKIDAFVSRGQFVTINTAFNQSAGAAILGAFLILQGFAPADALKLTAKKFPQLHFGMRLEQFLWDMDMNLWSGSD